MSLGTGMTTAMSLRTMSHGSVMWTPFAGRIESGIGALVERAHVVGPDAGGVDDDLGPRPSIRRPVGLDHGTGDAPVVVVRDLDHAAAVHDDRTVRRPRCGRS